MRMKIRPCLFCCFVYDPTFSFESRRVSLLYCFSPKSTAHSPFVFSSPCVVRRSETKQKLKSLLQKDPLKSQIQSHHSIFFIPLLSSILGKRNPKFHSRVIGFRKSQPF
ncbi:hypothetical protein VNO77_13513 [Canavalia gladiata]|uniref:Uncharacterized protein n=1 Tax=Canavalia gladiata TaxID=3824 RepID=A0AAN9QQB0_CANGL